MPSRSSSPRRPSPPPSGRPRRGAPAPPRAASARAAWQVYLLRCRDGSLYAGATNDLVARVARHAAGKGARYTRSRLPVVLVYHERAPDRSAALRREAAVKRLTRAEKLALVGGGVGRAGSGSRRSRSGSRSPSGHARG